MVFSIQTLAPKGTLLKPTVFPFLTLVTVTMGSQVFLNLKLFDKRQKAAANNGIALVKGCHPWIFFQSHAYAPI